MSVSHNIHSLDTKGSLGRQLILSCILIAGTTAVLLRVSGGMPPVTWILLFQLSRTLMTQEITREGALLLPFFVLIIQSFLLAIAWESLIWITICETVRFLAMRTKVQTDLSPSAPDKTTTSGEAQTSPNSSPQAVLEKTHSERVEQKDDEKPDDVTIYAEQAHILPDSEDILLNPFEEEIPFTSEQRSQRTPAKGSQQGDVKGETSSFSDATKASHVQNPFAVKPEVLNLFQSESTSEHPMRQLSRVEQELAQLFQETQRDRAFEQPTSTEDSSEKAHKVFVFGNPFEGPLPDVFEYDTDLKDSLRYREKIR
jgi:hypothetical protein